jgi:hypothetical protein
MQRRASASGSSDRARAGLPFDQGQVRADRRKDL